MAAAKIAADRGSPALEQVALADLVDARRTRPAPAADASRSTAGAAMPCWPRSAGGCPGCSRSGVSAGLHLVTWLPAAPGRGGGGQARPRRAGVGVDAVGAVPGAAIPGPGGLIFGYATASEQAIADGVARLAQVIGEL